VDGKRVQTQRCKSPSPTPCVFVTCIRRGSGRNSTAHFPMQNIVAKTIQQKTIVRDDVSLVLILTAVSCSSFFIVRDLVSTGFGDTLGDEVTTVDELVGTCAVEFDSNFGGLNDGTSEGTGIGYTVDDVSIVLILTAVSCGFFIVSRLLGGTGVKELVSTGVGNTLEVTSVDELVGTCIVSRLLGGTGVKELVSTGVGNTLEVTSVDELVGTCAGDFDSNFGVLSDGTSEGTGIGTRLMMSVAWVSQGSGSWSGSDSGSGSG
jgi:hypothetical protein